MLHNLAAWKREGIPVPIIHLLDSCVEIPQFGMIRSLKAHVSGAILMWEYVKTELSRTTAVLFDDRYLPFNDNSIYV